MRSGATGAEGGGQDAPFDAAVSDRGVAAGRALANIRFFRHIHPTTIADMERRCRWLDLEPGEVLVEAGEQPERVFFLLHGEIRLSLYTKIGKIVSLPVVSPGALVGVTALTPDIALPYSIDATMHTTLASMSVRTFREFMKREIEVVQALLGMLVERQHLLIAHIEELTTLNVRARIHNELVRLCRNSIHADGSAVIYPVPTHEEIAKRVGTQREAVSRELSHLQSMGAILRQDGALLVPDVTRLMDASGKPKV